MTTIFQVAPGSALPNVEAALSAALKQNITSDIEIDVEAGTQQARVAYLNADAITHIPHQFSNVHIKGVSSAQPKENVRAVFGVVHAPGSIAMPRPSIVANPFKLVSDKGIFVSDGANDITFENLEVFGARSSSQNGGAFRILDGQNVGFVNCVGYDNDNGVLHHQITGLTRIINSLFFNNGNPGKAGNQHDIYIGPCDELIIQGSASVMSRGQGHDCKSRARKTRLLNSAFADLSGNGSYVIDVCMGGELEIAGCFVGEGLSSMNAIAINYILEDDQEGRINHFNIHHNLLSALKVDNGRFLRIDPRLKIDNANGHDTYVMQADGITPLLADVTGSFTDNIIFYADDKNVKNTFGGEIIHVWPGGQTSLPNWIEVARNTLVPVDWARL